VLPRGRSRLALGGPVPERHLQCCQELRYGLYDEGTGHIRLVHDRPEVLPIVGEEMRGAAGYRCLDDDGILDCEASVMRC